MSLIGQRYELGPEIGAGGMGTVYRGVDTQSGDPVAIKLLKPEVLQLDPDMLERFEREGQALRELNHPNIVKMLAAIEESGQHYLMLEYVEGGSLRDVLDTVGAKPTRTRQAVSLQIERVLSIALDLADALTRAHRLNIVHRDIKPANVLLATDDTVRLTDFGIAYMQKHQRVTDTDSIVGTLDYLSPEVLKGEEISARMDIWAFGVLLFELLAGKHPFASTIPSATIMAILTEPTPDLEKLCPDCPVALVDLVYRMLAKDAQARIPSVRLVGAELEAIMQGTDIAFVGTRPAVSAPQPAGNTQRFATPTPAEKPKHNLPAQITALVGREAEIAEVLKLITDPKIRLVTIVAPGGMGKTRLSLEVAGNIVGANGRSPLQTFEHGVYFIELAPLSDPANIVTAIADAVGCQFYAGGDPQPQLLDFLRRKQLLLVMDNFEHLLDGAALVTAILEAAPQIKIIATSRERLRVSGENLFNLDGLDFPDLGNAGRCAGIQCGQTLHAECAAGCARL